MGRLAVVVEAEDDRAAGKLFGVLKVFGALGAVQIAGDAVELFVGAEEDLAAVVIGTGIGRQFFDMPIECEL